MRIACGFAEEDPEIIDRFAVLLKIKESKKSLIYGGIRLCNQKVCIVKYLQGYHPIYERLKQLPHPFLPEIFSVTYLPDTDETLVLEEMIQGTSIVTQKLSDELFVNAISELCTVLEFIHSHGIVHRDIKPSNILMTKDGHVHLIDFDAARLIKPGAHHDTCKLGTWGYASPEQFGYCQTDARSDIYSLGITMKVLLGDRVKKEPYGSIIRKATQFAPKDRFQSADELFRALRKRESYLWTLPFWKKC